MKWIALLFLFLASPAPAQLLDGDGAEHPLRADDAQDGALLEVRAAAFADALWIGLRFDRPVAITSGSGLVLHVDTDADPETGNARGCELVFDLRSRHGSLHPGRDLPGQGRMFERLGLKIAPSFASSTAEIVLPRFIRGGETIFDGSRARFSVVFEGDRAPDTGFVECEWSDRAVPVVPIDVERSAGLRIATWNVEQDGLFDDERSDAQLRLLRALDADVLVVGESFRHSAAEVRSRVGIFDHAVKADPGNVVLSRYPISRSWSILDGPDEWNGHRSSAALVESPAGPIMVLPQHWRCCRKEEQRVAEAEAVAEFLAGVEADTPVIVLGDLNLVTTRRPLEIVLGARSLTAVPARHSDAPFMHTWHSSGSRYYSARLDWILVSAGIDVLRAFVLDSGTMFGSNLETLGLRRRDSWIASDHMPVVVDVRW